MSGASLRSALRKLTVGLVTAAALAAPGAALALDVSDIPVTFFPNNSDTPLDVEITVSDQSGSSYDYGDGSAGFFRYIGAKDAASIVESLSGVTGADASRFFDEAWDGVASTGSPFNLDNIATSLDIIDKCNELRDSVGLPELRVDPVLMAYSQVCAAWGQHYGISGDGVDGSNVHSVAKAQGLGENFAWNTSTVSRAFVQWYDNEKKVYDSPEGASFRAAIEKYMEKTEPTLVPGEGHIPTCGDFNNSVYVASKEDGNSEIYHQVGHYLNIINPQYAVTGASYATAISGSPQKTYEQTFTFRAAGNKTYTTSELRSRLSAYQKKVAASMPHGVTIQEPSNGTVAASVSSATRGTKVTLTLDPDRNYYVAYDGVSVTGRDGTEVAVSGSGDTWTFTMPAQDVTVSVTFTVQRHYAEFYDGLPEHGTVTVSPAAPQAVGSQVTLTITPDEGYMLESISATNCLTNKDVLLIESGNTWTFTMPDADVRLSALFVPADSEHQITTSVRYGEGSVSVSKSSAAPGEMVSVTATPAPGYVVSRILTTDSCLDRASLAGDSSKTVGLTMPANDILVWVEFVKEGEQRPSIFIDESVKVEGIQLDNYWLFFFDPELGWKCPDMVRVLAPEISYIRYNTPENEARNFFEVDYPFGDIDQTFFTFSGAKAEPRTVSVTSSENGSVIASATSAFVGETVTLTLAPDEGYQVEDVRVIDAEGVSVASSGSGDVRTFVMPDSNVTVFATFAEKENEPLTFPDVAEGDWCFDAVSWVSSEGIMTGQADGTFAPSKSLQRCEMAQLLYNMAGSPAVDKNVVTDFPDCSVSGWYADAVAWAYQSGAITGYESGLFGISDAVTREQFATILWRLEGEPAGTGDLESFPDCASTSPFATEAMRWAVGEGIITGDQGKLSPVKELSRAEAATMIMRWKA